MDDQSQKPRRVGRGRAPGETMQRGTCPVCQEPSVALRTDGRPHGLHVEGRKHQDALRAQQKVERARGAGDKMPRGRCATCLQEHVVIEADGTPHRLHARSARHRRAIAELDAWREIEDFAASAARMYGLHVGSIGVRGTDVNLASPILTPPAS